MNSTATATTSADAGVERYREAERILWNHYGLQPTERFVNVSSPAARLRIVEVGSGPPLLLVPGTAGTGPYWGALVRELKGFRCLLLDRPGWGLSTPLDYSSVEYGTAAADLLRGVLDALEIDRADVVGASIGDVAFDRETDSMRNERDMVRTIVSWRKGLRPGSPSTTPSWPRSSSRRFSSTAPPIRSAPWRFGGVSSTFCPGASCRSWTAPGTCPGSTTRAGSRTTSAGFSPQVRAAGRS